MDYYRQIFRKRKHYSCVLVLLKYQWVQESSQAVAVESNDRKYVLLA